MSHQIKCYKSPFMYDMEPGSVYDYVVHESVVEYSLADCLWPEKKYMPIYAWSNALMQHEIIPVKDLLDEEN